MVEIKVFPGIEKKSEDIFVALKQCTGSTGHVDVWLCDEDGKHEVQIACIRHSGIHLLKNPNNSDVHLPMDVDGKIQITDRED